MHRSGKAHWLTIVGILSIVLIGVLALFSRDSPAATAGNFMDALGEGNVDKLVNLSYMPGDTPEQIRSKWTTTLDLGKYYRFTYRITHVAQSDEKTGAATMQVTRNAIAGSSYEEKFQLPLVKVDGSWKVDVNSISRGLFPALPR